MYSREVIALAESLASKQTLIVAHSKHPLRYVETGPEGQVFGTDFINEKAPKIISTLKLFKDTIIPVLNQTIKRVDESIKNIRIDLNQQDVMFRYNPNDMFGALVRQDIVSKREIQGFKELTFKNMTVSDVEGMPAFGNGIVSKLSKLTPHRTKFIYETYIQSMNKSSCSTILDDSAHTVHVEDRVDTIIVGLRILNAGIVGSVFTPDNPDAEKALRDNINILANIQLDFIEMFETDTEILGSIKNGTISLLPKGVELAGEYDRQIRGLALKHNGFFTLTTLARKPYGKIYEQHLAIKAILNKDKLNEARREVLISELDELHKLGTEFSSYMIENGVGEAIEYIRKGGLDSTLNDVRYATTYIFKNILFWKLPLGRFMSTVDRLLKEDSNLNMESAVVLATVDMIVDDITVGISSVYVGE